MSERDDAIALANRVLDKPTIDPDGDICMLARQFLREVEQNTRLVFVGDPHPVKDPVFRGAELVEESMQERIARAIQKRSGLSRAMAFVTADAVLEEIRTPTEAMRARRAEAVVRELRDPSREVIGALQGWAICEGYIPEGLNAAIDAAEKKVDEA